MEVVAAILRSREMNLGDVTRATGLFQTLGRPLSCFRSGSKRNELQTMPYVPVHCDICRDDLLFELELDAGRTTNRAGARRTENREMRPK